ncbi:hypothetical protein GGR54DRAFT_654900 [Hypoxylon sp. NC1633]|nr:hypothetical protein GGR54DRAFT_654900 [Hypoxylon sp. NC1633]
MSPTVVLITGTTRGIGKGLLELYLAKPNHVVISANRDPDLPASRALLNLTTADNTTHILVKIDAADPNDPANAVEKLWSLGIDHVDIVIANAGIGLSWPKVSEVETDEIQKHIEVNVYGFLRLYQAFLPVLKRSEKPTWVTIGSCAAWLTMTYPCGRWRLSDDTRDMIPMQNAAYAPTKLVVHWYTKAIHIEEPLICAFPIDPGWAQTDLGNRGAEAFGLKEATVPVSASAAGIVKVIDAAERETHGGKMWAYDGRQVPW